jgi:hypothetical protein
LQKQTEKTRKRKKKCGKEGSKRCNNKLAKSNGSELKKEIKATEWAKGATKKQQKKQLQ